MPSAIPIIVRTTLPTAGTKPNDPTLANEVARIDFLANMIEIFGTCSAGSGTAFLVKFFPEAAIGSGEWIPWGADALSGGFAVNSATRSGLFHARFAVPEKVAGDYLILFPAGATATECFVNGRML